LAQDDYYYEIQLTNKQLVFYFMAGAAGLILSFLAGVMVGRGVEGGAAGAAEPRPVAEERVVAEQSPAPAATPGPSDFSYPQRLETDRPEEGLERSRPGGAAATPTPPPTPGASRRAATPAPAGPAATPTPKPLPTVAPPAARPAPTAAAPAPTPTPPTLPAPPATTARPASAPLPKALASSSAGFAIQVGAFKDKASADSIVRGLKARGLPAYAVAPAGRSGGLFTVRVGVYRDRADAEAVQDRLRDDKFKPYIIKQ
jgi:cell division protein FtsN